MYFKPNSPLLRPYYTEQLIALATAINCSNFSVRYYTQAISIALVVAEGGFCIGYLTPENGIWIHFQG